MKKSIQRAGLIALLFLSCNNYAAGGSIEDLPKNTMDAVNSIVAKVFVGTLIGGIIIGLIITKVVSAKDDTKTQKE